MALEEHLVAFVDFLGFAEAVETSDSVKIAAIINALQELAATRTEFSLTREPQDPKSERIYIQPAITTFSDHVVISYPIDRLREEFADQVIIDVGLFGMQRMIARLD